MVDLETIDSMLAEAASRLGIGLLRLDRRRCCALVIDDAAIEIMHSRKPFEAFWLFTDLGLAPHEPDRLCGVMELGFDSWIAGRMTVGLDRDGTRLVGYSAVGLVDDPTLDHAALIETAIRGLAEAARDLARRLDAGDYTLPNSGMTSLGPAAQARPPGP